MSASLMSAWLLVSRTSVSSSAVHIREECVVSLGIGARLQRANGPLRVSDACELLGRHPMEWRPADHARVPQVREDRQLAEQFYVGRTRRERRARRSPRTSTLEVAAIGRERQAIGRLEHVTMQMSHERELALRLLADDVGGHLGRGRDRGDDRQHDARKHPDILRAKFKAGFQGSRVPGFRVQVHGRR